MIAGVPYDAEVEYLESTGTQWIDLGFKGTNLFTCDIGLYRATTTPRWDFGYNQSWSGGGHANSCGGFLESNGWMYLYVVDGNGMSWDYANVTQTARAGDIQLLVTRNSTTGLIARTINAEGITFAKANTSQAFATDGNLCLFKQGNNSAPSATSSGMRLKYCKINDGDNAVDLIPVRVGNVGYMYDRVFRRLFGNKGTGNFIVGPDVARPVMGLYFYKQKFYAKDYVQDGLVAMWDGIENAGLGVHDPNATVWKDLTGNGWDFPANNLRFHADHVEALADVSSAKSSTEFWDWTAATFESVCERPYTTTNNNGFFNLGRIGITNINNTAVSAYMWYSSQSYSNWRVFYLFSRGSDARNFDLAHRGFVTDFTSSIDNKQVFRNGIYVPSNLYSNESWTQTVAHNALRATLLIGSVGTPKYWCIRLYSRALTADEIAYNYSIDKARFNLP